MSVNNKHVWLSTPMREFQPFLHGRLLELLGASTQLTICSKSPCSIAISSWPFLQDAISSSPSTLQESRHTRVRTRSEHSSQSAHTLHCVRTHPGTIAERNLISAKLARLCGDIESKQKRLKSPHILIMVNAGAGSIYDHIQGVKNKVRSGP
jgi:hypothetical protein